LPGLVDLESWREIEDVFRPRSPLPSALHRDQHVDGECDPEEVANSPLMMPTPPTSPGTLATEEWRLQAPCSWPSPFLATHIGGTAAAPTLSFPHTRITNVTPMMTRVSAARSG